MPSYAIPPIERWEFTFSGDRLQVIESVSSFEEIVERIAAGLQSGTIPPPCCHMDHYRREGTEGFRRVIYCLTVGKPLFDQLFNSRHGYRASFFRSPYEGLRVNELLLRGLVPQLLESGDTTQCGETPLFIQESLSSESAKAWLAEAGAEFCPRCRGEWSGGTDTEIMNGRWELIDTANARWGRSAPYLTKIRVFGGFLKEAQAGYDELITARKRHRAQHIHDWGWS